ncbi:hypothetical protein SRB5_03600 [Streptomyces sp. RB5]|uniref:DUF6891 domain-containing protein n=1 Tax=Streptomyces smaragdinus TaxID=2585196 RepID=A0A7K0CA37_9ACTN|nr:hypothetical protein [Streptomyces smaragdinus]MQY10253.1 hypothetical protein [Streptomyces smaragdinus]
MLQVTVTTENGERRVRVSAGELAGLVRRIGGAGDAFLVLQRVPDLPDVFAQVLSGPGGYTLEYRAGAADRHFAATVDDADTVIAVLEGWAREVPGWDVGPEWSLLEMGPVPEAPPLPDDVRVGLEHHLREILVGGYTTRAELAENAEGGRVSRVQAEALADRLWLERVAEQARWKGETDPERLTRAFTALEAAGITARENFACCHDCGQAEIGGESAPDARGFVYFDHHATDAAAAGCGLSLRYGGFDGSADTSTAVGREVVAALEDAGLRTEWDHDPSQVIRVTPLDWCRRLVG